MNIYVMESVREVVAALQQESYHVDYNFKEDDPEYADGYITAPGERYNIHVVISSVVRWRKNGFICEPLENSKTCILIGFADSFWRKKFTSSVHKLFNVIREKKRT